MFNDPAQWCPTVKRHSPQMWRLELLCRHIFFVNTLLQGIFCFIHFFMIIFTNTLIIDIKLIQNTTFFCTLVQNLFNWQKYEIKEIDLVATFKLPVATCGEWRQGWTPLI